MRVNRNYVLTEYVLNENDCAPKFCKITEYHSSHGVATHPSHSVDRTGRQAKMAAPFQQKHTMTEMDSCWANRVHLPYQRRHDTGFYEY